MPTVADVKRLARLKAEQESRLKMLRARVDRLQAQERRVWKDVTWTQQQSLQTQEAQLRRQAQQAEGARHLRDLLGEEQARKEHAQQMRLRSHEAKEIPRLRRYEENKAAGKQVREESQRIAAELQDAKQRTLKAKASQVEARRQQRRQHKLRKELEQSRLEQQRQDENMMRYAELQEEIQSAEMAIASAERDELNAVKRLQNSQSVRAEASLAVGPHRGRSGRSSPRFYGGTPAAAAATELSSLARRGVGLDQITEEQQEQQDGEEIKQT